MDDLTNPQTRIRMWGLLWSWCLFITGVLGFVFGDGVPGLVMTCVYYCALSPPVIAITEGVLYLSIRSDRRP